MIGLAPTNAVVADLRKDGYSHAATLHRELGQLERGKTQLGCQDGGDGGRGGDDR